VKVAFRADASLAIGTGHVMRCLTLADALRVRGVLSVFLSRYHVGHLQQVFKVFLLLLVIFVVV
jgi:UDP-2,4-diacetamido-2,4,6-trideoxy-beta-L-altropyranose hydrolase